MQKSAELLRPREMRSALRIAIPFLNQLPNRIYSKLDTSEFYLPSGAVAGARVQLEELLGNYVMTYKRDVFNTKIPLTAHLCANIAGAELTIQQLKLLNNYEERFTEQGINFVVYAKPLTLINPTDSAMGKYYKQLGLPQ